MVGLRRLEGREAVLYLGAGYSLGTAEWMHRQQQQQAGDTTGEGRFLPSLPQER